MSNELAQAVLAIKNLIQDNELKKAASLLYELTQKLPSRFCSEVLVLKASVNRLVQDRRRGIIDAEAAEIKQKQLMFSMLDLLDELSSKEIEAKANHTIQDREKLSSFTVDPIDGDESTLSVIPQQAELASSQPSTYSMPSEGSWQVANEKPPRRVPWRVFISHTSELREFPKGGSYIDKAERAVSASGHAIVEMDDFPSSDRTPAQVCIDRVQGCDVYLGVFGMRYGSPVRDRPGVSYTELEFEAATDAGLPRLVFLIDGDSEELGLPPKALMDLEYGQRQQKFFQRVKEAGLTVQRFRNPDDLKALVERSLRELAAFPPRP
jgi:hypothetical protein